MESTGTTDPTDIQALRKRVEMLTDVIATTVNATADVEAELARLRATILLGLLIMGALAIRSQL